MTKLLVSLINIYQRYFSFDSGLLSLLAPGGACKYPITCSEYTKQSIIHHGTLQGIRMSAKRIWSCR